MLLSLSSPILPVQRAVLDRLADVRGADDLAAVEVGDGAGDLHDAVIGAGGQREAVEGRSQHTVGLVVHDADLVELSGFDAGVTPDGHALKAGSLDIPRLVDPTAYLCAEFLAALGGQVVVLDRRHLDMDVDAVQHGTGDAVEVLLHRGLGTGAVLPGMIEIPAGAGVHGGYQHEARRIGVGAVSAGDGHRAVLKRLAQSLEGRAG